MFGVRVRVRVKVRVEVTDNIPFLLH